MIFSKCGKYYDTADGSEQQLPHASREVNGRGVAKDRGSAQRWEDDGGAAASAQRANQSRSLPQRVGRILTLERG